MNKLKKYITLARAGIIESLQFRIATFVMIIGNILYLIIVYFLWKAIFASYGKEVVNGMTFESTLIYLVLATAIFGFMEMYAVWEIGRDIQSGKIVLNLIRPFEYRRYLFWSYSGGLIMQFATTFLPTFIIVKIITGDTIKLGFNLFYFAVSIIIATVINYNIDFIVGTICIYTESIWGINIMKQVIVLLLSGATIPIAFFPDSIRKIVGFLPFKSIYDAPLNILLQHEQSFETTGKIILVQLLWAVLLSLTGKLFWDFSIKRVTVNGG